MMLLHLVLFTLRVKASNNVRKIKQYIMESIAAKISKITSKCRKFSKFIVLAPKKNDACSGLSDC